MNMNRPTALFLVLAGTSTLLSSCRTIHAVGAAKHDFVHGMEIWRADIKPRLLRIEHLVAEGGSRLREDYEAAASLWQHDVEPRLARIEKLVGAMESKVAGDLRSAVVAVHRRIEGELSSMEAGFKSLDGGQLAAKYQGLVTDLRSIKVRLASDAKHSTLAKHVDSLVDHVKEIEQRKISGKAEQDVQGLRTKVEGDVTHILKGL